MNTSSPNSSPHGIAERTARFAVVTATTGAARAACSLRTGCPGGHDRLAAVVGEEELLERGLPAEQLVDAGGRQRAEQRLDRTDHLAAHVVALRLDGRDAGDARLFGWCCVVGGVVCLCC